MKESLGLLHLPTNADMLHKSTGIKNTQYILLL